MANPNGVRLSNSMVKGLAKLPLLADYTQSEIDKCTTVSPVLSHYLQLIQKPTSSPAQELRHERHQAWVLCALATITHKASAQEVCSFWSDAADIIAEKAWRLSGCDTLALAVFALGKWGSQELNLSSDIDVVFVSSENPDAVALKCVREFIALLAQATEFGFCFRVDTDLKPGGRLAPLVCSLKQYEDYYWSTGETWERLALVRLRPIVGQTDIIQNLLETVEKFVFRRHIDYSLLQDLNGLRAKIHTHYQQNEARVRNLKLSPGGIRDIELFIHALQVIHGGKIKKLRTTSTSRAAAQLKSEERFSPDDLDMLITNYWHFRELENYVQSLNDSQTHEWSAQTHGAKEYEFFLSEATKVSGVVETLLGKAQSKPTIPQDPQSQREWLTSLGYSENVINERLPELLSLTALSTRTLQDEEMRLRVLRKFTEDLAKVALDKNLGFALLIDFFRSMRAKTAFFSLLATEDRLIHELSVLFGCSPYLGGILTARPELIDSYLYRVQAVPPENFEQTLEFLAERRLLNEIISANQLLQTKKLEQHHLAMTAGADEICTILLKKLKSEVGESTLQIVALGKWGGREMGFRSDLDFIFVTDHAPTANDQKISKRFLSRLTEHHRGGAIYEMDMRLRPSGKGGPILVSCDDLITYLQNVAVPWERQSYLRARPIESLPGLEQKIHAACTAIKLSDENLHELDEIGRRLLRDSTEQVEIKFAAGGLVDIEFSTQVALLDMQIADAPTDTVGMIEKLAHKSEKWAGNASHLIRGYTFLRLVEQLYQLMNQHPAAALNVSSDGFQRAAAILNLSTENLHEKLTEVFTKNQAILKALDPRKREK